LDEEEHFFRVTMQGVHRFHRDDLMNINAVREYLSQVAPVPFRHSNFPYARIIEDHLAAIDGYQTYTLSVDGQQVYRPHMEQFSVSGQSCDRISGVELIDLRGHEGQSIGRGWYARLNYLASIPPKVGMRGIRIRQGNIEVGDERFLADFFTEHRFATWHIGEIHLNYSLKTNARRDGFEQSPDFEAFIEQASLLGRHLSYLCRAASKARSRRLGATQMLAQAESIVDKAFFLTEEHLRSALAGAEAMLSEAEHSLYGTEDFGEIQKRIAQDRKAIGRLRKTTPLLHTILDGRSLRHMGHKELITSIAQGVLEQHSKHRSAESLIRAVLHPYIKPAHSARTR
jgi:molecular chaperone HtpG